ncbi:MAG: hypothetical protein NTY02_04540, partial [Acidobacteria bacterium]|nr:hypothetical protein [Acidobacteriota bacterium]
MSLQDEGTPLLTMWDASSIKRAVAFLLAVAMICVAERDAAAGTSVPAEPQPLAIQEPALLAVGPARYDLRAWQLVATGRYLAGDFMGALDAWNRSGEPRIDTIDVDGAERTRQPVVVRAAGLQSGQALTRETFGRALRRLRDLPVASSARLSYEPIDGGLANVDVVIDERSLVPRGWRAIATVGARALFLNELRLDVAGA